MKNLVPLSFLSVLWIFELLVFVGCSRPVQETIHYGRTRVGDRWVAEKGACCGWCNTLWGEEDIAYCEWHLRELNMMMYASGCKRCRYHGAYKDMKSPDPNVEPASPRLPPPIQLGGVSADSNPG